MKRGYTALEYRSIVRRLRKARPGLSASPRDFIVGFPGETEADFDATLKLVARDRLRRLVHLPVQPAPRHAGRRACPMRRRTTRSANGCSGCSAQLERAGARDQRAHGRQRAARPGRGPVEEGVRSELAGRTANNRVVEFPGPPRLVGSFVDVRVTEARPHSLRGELVE